MYLCELHLRNAVVSVDSHILRETSPLKMYHFQNHANDEKHHHGCQQRVNEQAKHITLFGQYFVHAATRWLHSKPSLRKVSAKVVVKDSSFSNTALTLSFFFLRSVKERKEIGQNAISRNQMRCKQK